MKKRNIIAVIITIITVFLSNKIWLNFKPMIVDFDIYGKGNYDIEVQLNKKDNDKFDKIKSLAKIVETDKTNHAQYIIPRSKTPKRVRFVVRNFNKPCEISNITLKNGKYKINDLKEFSVNTGKLAVENNKLVITPPPRLIVIL